MELRDASIAMIHQGPHPAHRGFAESVGADLINYNRLSFNLLGGTLAEDVLNGICYPSYDVYLVEGSRPLYAALTRRLFRGGRLVYLCADHGLFQIGNPHFEGESFAKSVIGRFGVPVAKIVGRNGIDGVIAVSQFVQEFTRPFVGEDTPIEVAHPFIQPETYKSLSQVSPSIESNTAVTVARSWKYKGVDMLVDAWSDVRTEFPSAELHVVGSGHPESYGAASGVTVHGYVEDLADAFEPASLFVQPSRVDAFPVSTLEAMYAGLPPLVTSSTGTKSEAKAVDPSLVVKPTKASLAEGVKQYFRQDQETRREFSLASHQRGGRFDANSRKVEFRKAFARILKEF